MNHKVLLADDSLTIQKVIRITLANQPYDIVDCSTDDDLFRKLPEVKPVIVFLDFNLSDKYTGYELSKKIKEISPSTQVLLLLGTFDTVDEELMTKNGISERIVKPFDSNKFIAICKRLAEVDQSFETPYPETKASKEEEFSAPSEEDNWTVTRAAEIEDIPVEKQEDPEVTPEELNALHKQMTDWGINVPEVIGVPNKSTLLDIPPVIEDSEEEEETTISTDQITAKTDKTVLPSSEDLEWPTLDEVVSEPKSKLISIETFSIEEDFSEDKIRQQKLYGIAPESDVRSIEDQIREEVENDLWSADEFEIKPKLKVVKEDKPSQLEKSDFKPTLDDFDESLFAPLDEGTTPWHESNAFSAGQTTTQVNKNDLMNELRPMIEESVKKAVKEYLDIYLKQSVEKVTWEVIPDLAENLIRQELHKISQQILGE